MESLAPVPGNAHSHVGKWKKDHRVREELGWSPGFLGAAALGGASVADRTQGRAEHQEQAAV